MKRIIIATDFSAHSKRTIDTVLSLVKDTTIPHELVLLNTYLIQHSDPKNIIALNDELKKSSLKGLEDTKQEILAKLANPQVNIKTASHLGTLSNVVSNFLQETPVDLMAIGNDYGRNVESVTGVLKSAGCPLLVTF